MTEQAISEPEKGLMENQDVAQSGIRGWGHRLPRKGRLGLLVGTLLAAGVATLAAVNYTASKAPMRVHGVPARIGWYFQDGRLQADMRTFASMCKYVVAGEREVVYVPVPVNPPVAKNTEASPPKS
jgi:hypothetical protein